MPSFQPRKRQLPIPTATGEGIDNASRVVDTAIAAGATGLVINASGTTELDAAPTFQLDISTQSSSRTRTFTSAEPTVSTEATHASSSSIAMSTVIGACVGAFIGAAALILLSLYFYRQYNLSLKRKAGSSRAVRGVTALNNRGDLDRRRSKLEKWDRLHDSDRERWSAMQETKEMDTFGPGGMYHESRSGHSTSHNTHPTSPSFSIPAHPYASASSSSAAPRVPEPRDILGREPQNLLGAIDSGPAMSWGSSSTRLSGGAMSPSLSMAIPTPVAVTSQLHRWESAEVVHAENDDTASKNPFSDALDNTANTSSSKNPFFGASNDYTLHKRTRSTTSTRSRSSSTATVKQGTNPFSDPEPLPPLQKPSAFTHHVTSDSTSSSADRERALKQLLAAAALDDVSEVEAERRLRVASMQPSIISNSGDSMYTDAGPDPVDEETMRSFPVPPSSSGHETQFTHVTR